MNEFFIFGVFAIGASVIVIVQGITLAMFAKWNRELREENERLQPPF